MGFKEESLETEVSTEKWNSWKENNCQPNFWLVNHKQRPRYVYFLYNHISRMLNRIQLKAVVHTA